jgi:uncharacterized protein YbbC (DUF1343 family)
MPAKKKSILTGLDLLEKLWPRDLRGARAGLVVHPASIDRFLSNAVTLARQSKQFKVTTLFGPQHGILGQTQDMIEGKSRPRYRHPRIQPVRTAQTPPRDAAGYGCPIIDLEDVGNRYYTFIWTLELWQTCRAGRP